MCESLTGSVPGLWRRQRTAAPGAFAVALAAVHTSILTITIRSLATALILGLLDAKVFLCRAMDKQQGLPVTRHAKTHTTVFWS